ncbi:hypothetical protein ACFLUA_04835 [Chloroflexota bacterium]
MTWIIVVIVALVVSFGITVYFRRSILREEETDWGKAAIFFILMLLGMLAREVYNMLVNGKEFNWTGLAIASVVSPIVFGAVFSQVGTLQITVPSTTLAFQNGFFWNSIFEGIGPPQT